MKQAKTLLTGAAAFGLAAALAGCGPANYSKSTGGSEQLQQKVQQGQPLYTPPPDALPPGARGGGMTMPMPPGPGGTTAPTAPR